MIYLRKEIFVKLPKVGGSQISSANIKFADSNFEGFADLPQMWHIAGLRFADPIIFFELKTSANPHIYNFSPYKYKFKMLSFKFKDDFWLLEQF